MTRHDFTIGFLSLSAILLFVGIMIVSSIGAPVAEANSGMSVAGQYTLFIGQAGVGFSHAYVVDGNRNKLLTYRLQQGTGRVELTSVLDLGTGGGDAKDKKRRP